MLLCLGVYATCAISRGAFAPKNKAFLIPVYVPHVRCPRQTAYQSILTWLMWWPLKVTFWWLMVKDNTERMLFTNYRPVSWPSHKNIIPRNKPIYQVIPLIPYISFTISSHDIYNCIFTVNIAKDNEKRNSNNNVSH